MLSSSLESICLLFLSLQSITSVFPGGCININFTDKTSRALPTPNIRGRDVDTVILSKKEADANPIVIEKDLGTRVVIGSGPTKTVGCQAESGYIVVYESLGQSSYVADTRIRAYYSTRPSWIRMLTLLPHFSPALTRLLNGGYDPK